MKKIIIHIQDRIISYAILEIKDNEIKFLLNKNLYLKKDENLFDKIRIVLRELNKNWIYHNQEIENFQDKIHIFISTSNSLIDNYTTLFKSEEKKIKIEEKFIKNFILNYRKNKDDNLTFVDKNILNIKINSYDIDDIYYFLNKEFQEIKTSNSDFLIEKKFLDKLKEVLEEEFPVLKAEFYSFHNAFLKYLLNSTDKIEKEFIFLESSSNHLRINLYKNGEIIKTYNFDFDLDKIINEIQSSHNFLDYKTAKSFLINYLNDDLLEKESEKISQILKKHKKEILEHVPNFKENIFIPDFTFLVDNFSLMTKMIKKEFNDIFPNLIVLNRKNIFDYVIEEEKLNSSLLIELLSL